MKIISQTLMSIYIYISIYKESLKLCQLLDQNSNLTIIIDLVLKKP